MYPVNRLLDVGVRSGYSSKGIGKNPSYVALVLPAKEWRVQVRTTWPVHFPVIRQPLVFNLWMIVAWIHRHFIKGCKNDFLMISLLPHLPTVLF